MKALPDDASTDQSGNIPSGYYRRANGMLHMLPVESADKPSDPLAGDVDITDKAALKSLAMAELVVIIQKNKGDIKGVNACNALLDRAEGKPMQAITNVNINTTVDPNYGVPESMRIEMMRHKVRLWDEQQAKTIENEPLQPM